jgi:hypothetical protein
MGTQHVRTQSHQTVLVNYLSFHKRVCLTTAEGKKLKTLLFTLWRHNTWPPVCFFTHFADNFQRSRLSTITFVKRVHSVQELTCTFQSLSHLSHQHGKCKGWNNWGWSSKHQWLDTFYEFKKFKNGGWDSPNSGDSTGGWSQETIPDKRPSCTEVPLGMKTPLNTCQRLIQVGKHAQVIYLVNNP